LVDGSLRGEDGGMKRCRSRCPAQLMPWAFAGYRFPADVILLAVR
jgi:hypothetical protein